MKYVVVVEFEDPRYNVTTLPFDTLEEAMEEADYQDREYESYGGISQIYPVEE